MKLKEPPVGIEPRYIYESIRITQITDAIRRYLDADKDIPIEWIEEYNDLQSRQIHVIPLGEDSKLVIHCDICGQEHRVGETCPYEQFSDPPPRPDRCYVCGFYHSLGVACPDTAL